MILVQPSSEATGSWSSSPLFVSRDSFSLQAWAREHIARSTTYSNGYLSIFLKYYLCCHVWWCTTFLWPLSLGWRIIYILKCASFWLHVFCGWLERWVPVNWFNHTSWMAVVTPIDHPKSVRNRFDGVFVLLIGFFFLYFRLVRGFCHRTMSYLFLFLSRKLRINQFRS